MEKTQERQRKANVKDLNGDGCRAKELAAIRPECYTKKKSTKGPKSFDKKPDMAGPGNTVKKFLIYLEQFSTQLLTDSKHIPTQCSNDQVIAQKIIHVDAEVAQKDQKQSF